jgi:hypothetical protein
LGIYSGAFDAGQPSGIRWGKAPELSPGVNQRFMDFAVCNGSLYATTQKRLYQRVSDGPSPHWKLLLDFRRDSAIRAAYGDKLDPGWAYYDHIRAMRTVPNPSGAGETLIFGALNRIFRLDPTTDRIEPEVDIRELFRKQLGMDVYYVQTQNADRIRRPDGRESLFIGLELMFGDEFVAQHPEVPVSSVPDQSWSRRGAGTVHWAKQGFYLERWCENGAAQYALREVHDATRTTPDWLARVRSVCESPFAEEKGKAVYAGGFGAWGLGVSNTGWIYRGEFQTPTPQGN